MFNILLDILFYTIQIIYYIYILCNTEYSTTDSTTSNTEYTITDI